MPPKKRKKPAGRGNAKKREDLARQYGFVQAFFDASPELKKLFNTAVRKTYTSERFVAELRDTKWFRKNSVTVRSALMQKTADPATYKQRVTQLLATIEDTWGATFGPTAGAMMDKGEMRRWAETAYVMGWSEAQVINQLSSSVNYQKLLRNQELGGTAADLKNKFTALGRAYGLNPGDKYLANQVERVIEGRDTAEGVASRLKEWSKREYRAFAAELDGGATIEDIAAPYTNTMAELLEMNPEAIHARDGMIQKALKATTKDGQPAVLSLRDFEDMVRKDNRWQYTDNAREQAMTITSDLLQSFGLAV